MCCGTSIGVSVVALLSCAIYVAASLEIALVRVVVPSVIAEKDFGLSTRTHIRTNSCKCCCSQFTYKGCHYFLATNVSMSLSLTAHHSEVPAMLSRPMPPMLSLHVVEACHVVWLNSNREHVHKHTGTGMIAEDRRICRRNRRERDCLGRERQLYMGYQLGITCDWSIRTHNNKK